ncbi:MAG: hypothetical protein ACPK85_08380 [Methanosarcina sp.]
MNLSAMDMNLSNLNLTLDIINDANFTILVGVFVTLIVMGIASLYDNYKLKNNKEKNNTAFNKEKPGPSLDLNKQKKNAKEINLKEIQGSGKLENNIKIGNQDKETLEKENSGKSKNAEKLSNKIENFFGNFRSKISSLSLLKLFRKNKTENEDLIQSQKDIKSSKNSGSAKTNSFDVDKIVAAKKEEFDFDGDLLNEMSTAHTIGNIKNNKDNPADNVNNAASFDSDLSLAKKEFDMEFGAMDDDFPEGDLFFKTTSGEGNLADKHDSLLNSLKNDIVINKEKKIDFMTSMQGENLDLKLIKSDLEDVLIQLKKYKRYSNHH